MASKIFVNLPVKDLKKSMTFFNELGFTYNAQFTNDDAACMIIAEDNYVMLLTEPFFKGFTGKEIPDTSKNAQVIIALSVEKTEKVKDLVNRAYAAGAKKYAEPRDYGFMYQESFEDPDGHLWEVFFMDESAVKANPEPVAQTA